MSELMSNRRRRSHVGRLRLEISKLLSEHFGFDIPAEDISPVTGFWLHEDVYRWEVFSRRPGSELPIMLGCWETMTVFVRDAKRFGFVVDNATKEIYAHETKQPATRAGERGSDG